MLNQRVGHLLTKIAMYVHHSSCAFSRDMVSSMAGLGGLIWDMGIICGLTSHLPSVASPFMLVPFFDGGYR